MQNKQKKIQPYRILRKLYKLLKACKSYYSPLNCKYYIFLIPYLPLCCEWMFNDEQKYKLGLKKSGAKKNQKYEKLQIMKNNMNAPILCVDFDGVIHSYISGWKGATNLPDPPVDGSIEWLKGLLGRSTNEEPRPRFFDFKLAIYSARSQRLFGRRAMKKWLMKYNLSKSEIRLIDFPLIKPQLYLQIDDRAITFTGKFPTVKEMKNFQPWYKNLV